MADTKRIIIGSENNDDRKITLDELGTKVTLPVSLYNSSGAQIDTFPISGAVTISLASTIGSGNGVVTAAGTRVQLSSSSVSCKRIILQAHENNTGTLVWGDSNVVAALTGRRGKALFATQSDEILVNNLNLIYLDSTASGDQFTYIYEN